MESFKYFFSKKYSPYRGHLVSFMLLIRDKGKGWTIQDAEQYPWNDVASKDRTFGSFDLRDTKFKSSVSLDSFKIDVFLWTEISDKVQFEMPTGQNALTNEVSRKKVP